MTNRTLCAFFLVCLCAAARALGAEADPIDAPVADIAGSKPLAPVVPIETPVAEGRFPRYRLQLFNSGYAYNGENDAWQATRVTLTYFENLFEPSFVLDVNPDLRFKAGVGLLLPFDQEQKISRYYPVIQTRIRRGAWTFVLGSLEGEHDFPAPLLDPLVGMVPQLRLGSSTQIPITYETFPNGIHSHGRYEYGAALRWEGRLGTGELYYNWQLPDTANHRERFDIGLTHRAAPWYLGVHYWHNGGHENPHPVEITENYTLGAGLRTDRFTALYLASYYLPDRSGGGKNVFGQALFFEAAIPFFGWVLTPQLFVSDELRTSAHRFISVEGDPFFRVPLYLGLNVSKRWRLFDLLDMRVAFINGLYQTDRTKFSPGIARYDQMIRADLVYDIDL